ncbi:MAG: V-type ATPase subunit [Candidatus Hydrogenedentes bacterium]|nr:V-type ATPase subunit [Candidatus Hydrogenedentota bacterium]
MIALARYAEANTVTRAMLSDLLSTSDYDALIRTSTLAEAWNYLRKTAYAPVLFDHPSDGPAPLEHAIRTACALRFKRSIARLHGRARPVAQLLLSRWDLDNLEFALRHWHGNDRQAGHIKALPSFADAISYEGILNAGSLGEVLAAVQDTPYADPIALSASEYKQKQSIFFVEIALEKDYYRRLLLATSKLWGPDARDGLAALGAEIDALNLSWLGRLLQSKQVESGELSSVLIPGPSPLTRRLTHKSASPSDLQQLHTDFAGRFLPVQRDTDTEIQRLGMLEDAVRAMAVEYAQRALGRYPFRISTVFACYVLLRAEMKNLCTVLAGKSAGYSEHEFHSRLLMVRRS